VEVKSEVIVGIAAGHAIARVDSQIHGIYLRLPDSQLMQQENAGMPDIRRIQVDLESNPILVVPYASHLTATFLGYRLVMTYRADACLGKPGLSRLAHSD
jgi:hypothetical protein